jgi:hypothetical protein
LKHLKKSYELKKKEYNTKWWNYERANKGIEKIVYSSVHFACATFGPLHHIFTQKYLHLQGYTLPLIWANIKQEQQIKYGVVCNTP